jgi:reactive intermediate/imine deaminase
MNRTTTYAAAFCLAAALTGCAGVHERGGNATIAHSPAKEASMSRKIISSDRAPKAIGPYSQAVQVGNTIYTSGQVPFDPATGELVTGDIATQTRRVFENLKAVLEAGDASFADVARVGIYLTDLSNFAAVNAVMAEYFKEPFPARSTIGVAALPRSAQVEIDMVAVKD